MSSQLVTSIKPSQIPGSDPQSTKYLIVPIFIFFALLIFAMIRGPQIISGSGIGTAIMVSTPLILATYGLTALCLAGRVTVDLSIGPLIGFINVTTIQLYAAGYIQSPVSYFICALAIGVIYQFLYALIVLFIRVQPIIVALSMFLAFSGINLVILPRPGGRAPDWMLSWSAGTEIIQPVLILLIFSTLIWYALTHTAYWQHLKLMGSDEKSAYTSGVRIYLVRIGAHIIGGVYAALAAIAFTGLIGSGDPTQGTTYTLMAVTALVLGGSSLVGGRGGAFGAILGSLNIYLINFILSTFRFERFQSFVTDLSYGAVLVASLLILIALPYIQKLSNKIIVIKFGGNAMGKKEYVTSFAKDIVLLQQVGMLPVVVHGGGPQIGEMLSKLEIKTEFINGLRVTDSATIDVVEMVLSGVTNKSIVTAIANEGAKSCLLYTSPSPRDS